MTAVDSGVGAGDVADTGLVVVGVAGIRMDGGVVGVVVVGGVGGVWWWWGWL